MTIIEKAKMIDELYQVALNDYHELETYFVVYKAFGKVDEAERCYELMNEALNIMEACIKKKEDLENIK